MKKFILLVLILTTFLNCSKTDDDIENLCNSNCTTLKGRIVSENNTPIKNIKLSLEYRISHAPFSASTRIIKETETDENGFYSMEFYLEDSEIGEIGQGYFALLINASNLSTEEYIRKDEIYIAETIYSLPIRDTVIEKSFYIPTKEFITVTLNNFIPLNSNDKFEVQILYSSGLNIGQNDLIGSQYASQLSDFGNYISINQFETFNNVIVARNEKNLITIIKVKNGIATTENLLIFVPENNNINLTYEY